MIQNRFNLKAGRTTHKENQSPKQKRERESEREREREKERKIERRKESGTVGTRKEEGKNLSIPHVQRTFRHFFPLKISRTQTENLSCVCCPHPDRASPRPAVACRQLKRRKERQKEGRKEGMNSRPLRTHARRTF